MKDISFGEQKIHVEEKMMSKQMHAYPVIVRLYISLKGEGKRLILLQKYTYIVLISPLFHFIFHGPCVVGKSISWSQILGKSHHAVRTFSETDCLD